MKKSVLTIAIFVLSFYSHAQFNKGSFLFGGSGAIESSGSAEGSIRANTKTNFTFTPTIGYFLLDNFVLGAKARFKHEVTKSAGPFVRYYFPLNYFSPFVQIESTHGLGSIRTVSVEDIHEGTTHNYGGGIGVSKKINSIIQLDLVIGYFYSYSNFDTAS